MRRNDRRRSEAVTMATVAARAGVSTMTVSNVINGVGRASAETRALVRAMIAELGYAPNVAAKGLASASPVRIGIIYTHEDSQFVSAALVAALRVAADAGVQLLMRDPGEEGATGTEAAMRALIRSGARAIFLLPPFAEMLGETTALSELDLPVAAIGTGRAVPGMFTVRIDERAAAYAVTDLLARQGHRRIGFIAGPPTHSGSHARRAGYRAALAAHGLAADPALQARGDYTFASGLAAAALLLDGAVRPSAIFASNDEMAAATIWVAHSRGMTLPDELAIAGFDDAPIATRVFPALTAASAPVATMAAQAVAYLIDAMRNPSENMAGGDRLLDFMLVERQSTSMPPQ